MTQPKTTNTPEGRRIAYHHTEGDGPTVVFLGGFKSDMEGSKALHLEDWAKGAGRAFLRFDYSGHGQSSGAFTDGTIGDWFADAKAALGLIDGKVILVGSSMGGWISLLVARAMPEKIAALVTIAAAPDFTVEMDRAMTDAQRTEMRETGQVLRPSDYADEPYIITRRLIEDGAQNLVLTAPLPLPFPTRFLQGTDDTDVTPAVALRLLDHADGGDMRLTLVKGADHRFSSPECLALLVATIEDVLQG